MKIKARLLIGAGISISLVLLFSLMVYVSFNEVAEENERELTAHEIHKTVSELDIIMYEYLTYREERMLQQWNSKYDSTAEIIEKAPEGEWKVIKLNYDDLKELFSKITANYEKEDNSELEERLVAEFLIKSHAIISDSSTIAEEAYNNAILAQKTANNSMVITFIILVVALMGVSLYTARRITEPLYKLAKGTKIIGKGDLKHVIDIKSRDEIGELASAFNQMTNDLKELDILKTQFLTTTSHELKTPITPIIIQSQMLLEGSLGHLTKKQKKSADIILRNMEHLNKLISDILDISKIQSARLKLVSSKAQIGVCIKETIENMKPAANQKKIIFITKIAALPKITFDKGRIEQVLTNLINNAIKFTPEKGKIMIESAKQGDSIIVKVKDIGMGIKKENLNKIFKPFAQVAPSYAINQKGTGLGLAICKGIIGKHGGKIWAESTFGKGSTFSFTLPIKRR